MSIAEYLLVGLAAVGAGLTNALAGGATLITFPTLIPVGMPPIAANVTNTVALCPGYLGGTLAQANDLRSQERRLWFFVPAGVLGGVISGILLLNTGERLFRELVPFLILLASGLLAVQDPLRAWLARRAVQRGSAATSEMHAVLPVGLASIYGGYFGAGLSVIVLAVLGLTLDDSLTRLNALNISLDTNKSLVYTANEHRLIVTIGVNNLVVVDTGDVLLVCEKDQAQRIRQIVNQLKQDGQVYL